MSIVTSLFAFLATLTLATGTQSPAARVESFPASTALAEGVSPEALAGLSQLVQAFVDDEEIIGAELLVIKNGRSILHAAFGWRDREQQLPMETGSVFCVRSMTKPLIGTAILMLIDDGQLDLGDRVAEYLPAFDVEGQREITVEQLLSHTSGLPMSMIFAKDLRELDGIAAVAELGAQSKLEFEAGTAFNYSDQGADTLTALIEIVSGVRAAKFVRTRVLDALGMRDSACVMTEDHPLRARGCSKYSGGRGEWTRFWSPDEPPLFPFFLGSQGLYSTAQDYARFMDFWRRKGRVGKQRLLRSRLVRKALSPSPQPFPGTTGMPGLSADYGFLMQLWMARDEQAECDDAELVAFGHSGSDGTHAWVFPDQNAIVLYFTQSRGNTTGLIVEEKLGELFLGAPYDPNQAAPPFEQYLGYYWEGEGDLYRAIIRDGEDLALEIMGKGVVPLTYVGEDRWKFRPNPAVVLAFDRSDAGEVTGYHIGDHQEFRFEASAELPSAIEVAARVARTHRIDLLESLGPLRIRSELEIEKLGITGEQITLLAWPDRYRVDSNIGEKFERLAYDGEHIRSVSSDKALARLEGGRAESLRGDSPLVRLGDWRRWYPRLEVIQRLQRGGRSVVLVRTGDTSAPAVTIYVDLETGRVLREDGLTYIDGMGRIGHRTTFSDYRDVSGVLLPFRIEVVLANPLIGMIRSTVDEVELGVELFAGVFELGE